MAFPRGSRGDLPDPRTGVLPPVNTRNPAEVLEACREAYRVITGHDDGGLLDRGFRWIDDAFAGRNEAYEPLDTRYHDLEHTLQGALCLARLLRGWHACGGLPALEEPVVRLGLLAILLHDTGYLKPRGDRDGTGAKFTLVHVRRSAEFAEHLLTREGFAPADARAVGQMIQCTGCNVDVSALHFRSDVERLVGYALASADLLAQIAADDYLEKLPFLYEEFAEAQHAATGGASTAVTFASPEELRRQTPAFWDHYVMPHLETVYRGVYRYLADPPPHGVNAYLRQAEANIARLRPPLPSLPAS